MVPNRLHVPGSPLAVHTQPIGDPGDGAELKMISPRFHVP